MRGSFHLLHLLGARIKFKNVAGMPMALEVESRTLSSAVGGLACIIFPWVRETVAPSSATPVFIINNSALYLQKGITDARWLCHCCMTLEMALSPHKALRDDSPDNPKCNQTKVDT